jgi:hypothetical protein
VRHLGLHVGPANPRGVCGMSGNGVHTGRAIVRATSCGRVLVLCPVGHLVQSLSVADWPGSSMQARCAAGHVVECEGARS